MAQRYPRFSVIVPTYFGGRGLERCVDALLDQLAPEDELIVVADGPSDRAWERLDETAVRTIVNPVRRGPAFARNRGASEAQGDLLLFIDADCVVRPGTLALLREAFEHDPTLSAAIGSYDDAPDHPSFPSQYRNLLHHYVHQRSRDVIHTFWGACGAVRREAFLAAGGFDEGYGIPCVEDIEFGYRLSGAGHRIQILKKAQVQHLKEWTVGSIIRTDVLLRAAPWTELILRYSTLEDNLNTSVRSRVSVATVGLSLACVALALPFAAMGSFGLAGAAALGAVATAAAAVVFNRPFYEFLTEVRGRRFAARAIPWHLTYLASAGVGAVLGTVRYLVRPTSAPTPRRALDPHRSPAATSELLHAA